MHNATEYLFAADLPTADRAVSKKGWHPHGRTGWIRPNGKEVHFIFFAEDVATLDQRVTIYVVGELPPKLKRLDRRWKTI
jgi:hypothetical protein